MEEPFDNPVIRAYFIAEHGEDIYGSQFMIGDIVLFYDGTYGKELRIGMIEAVNFVDDNFEYLISTSNRLWWERELAIVEN